VRGSLAFRAYGLDLGVCARPAELLDRLRPLLPPERKPIPISSASTTFSLEAEGEEHVARHGREVIGRSSDLTQLLDHLEGALKLYVAEMARTRLFLHAGVVGWKGQAIVLPGRTFAGKSTLVRALVEAGATYYSDEYAVLDRRGRVHPYLAALSERTPKGRVRVPAGALGVSGPPPPLPIGLVADLQYQAGRRFSARRIERGAAVLLTLQNAVAVRRRPKATLAWLSRALFAATTLNGIRGESHQTVPRLIAYLESRHAD
jgi:hypothetical protein